MIFGFGWVLDRYKRKDVQPPGCSGVDRTFPILLHGKPRVDLVLTQMNKADEDMRHVRMLWKLKGDLTWYQFLRLRTKDA